MKPASEPTAHAKVLRVRRSAVPERSPADVFAALDGLVAIGATGDHEASRAALRDVLDRLDPVPVRATA